MGVIPGRVALNSDALEPLLPEGRDSADLASEVQRDLLGSIVLRLLQTMLPLRINELEMPRAVVIVRQLRRRVSIMLVCMVLMASLAAVLIEQGIVTYVRSDDSNCSFQRLWIIGFIVMQLCCMPQLTLLFIGWCLSTTTLMQKTGECQDVRDFLIEACYLYFAQLAMLLICGLATLSARPLIERLRDLMTISDTDPEVLALIDVVPYDEVIDEECVICLSSHAEEGDRWRKLACGHRFHELCVLEWLKKARRCPVCRLDLHAAYRLVLSGRS